MEIAIESSSENIEENIEIGKYLTFPLGDTAYGIDIKHVLEVVIRNEKMKITKVPHMPDYTKGVINLRGRVIPILDLRKRFLMEEYEYTDRSCFIVVNIQGKKTALSVDTVSGVMSIPNNNIDPTPHIESEVHSSFIQGMAKTENQVYIILDVNQLLEEKELEEFSEFEEFQNK